MESSGDTALALLSCSEYQKFWEVLGKHPSKVELAWQHAPTRCPAEPRQQKKCNCLCVAQWPGSHFVPKRGPVVPERFTYSSWGNICFSSFSAPVLPILLPANLFPFSFVSLQLFSSVYVSISLAFPLLRFLLPLSTNFHSWSLPWMELFFLTPRLLFYSSFSKVDFSISFLPIRRCKGNTRYFLG